MKYQKKYLYHYQTSNEKRYFKSNEEKRYDAMYEEILSKYNELGLNGETKQEQILNLISKLHQEG